MLTGRVVIFEIVERGTGPQGTDVWRASLKGADHVGGTGFSPQEAFGFLCFNHPQRMGIVRFDWKNRPPKLPGSPVELYPEGIQEPFKHETSGS